MRVERIRKAWLRRTADKLQALALSCEPPVVSDDPICEEPLVEAPRNLPEHLLAQGLLMEVVAARPDLEVFIVHFAREASRRHFHRISESPSVSARAKRYIDQHVEHRITIADVSRAAGAGRSAVCDSFQRDFGVSIHAYVVQKRLDLAAGLLVTTNDKIEAVAYAVGFARTSFVRAFRHHFGVSPSQFRGRNR